MTTLHNYRWDPIGMPPNTLATLFLGRYNNLINSFSNPTLGLNGRTVNLTVRDARTSVIVYGATPYTFVGYSIVEIAATVDAVATVTQVDQDWYMEWASTGQDMGAVIGQKLFNQAQKNVLNAAAIATFSI
jgi:hypothetical protein